MLLPDDLMWGIPCPSFLPRFQGCFKPKGNQTPKEFLQKVSIFFKKKMTIFGLC